MRIAINTRFLQSNRLEGIGRFTYEVAKRLVERRPSDEFIFLFDRPFDIDFIKQLDVETAIVPPPARHPILWYVWFEYAIPYILRKKKADAFVSMDGYCSIRTKVPTVMVTHDIAHVHYPTQIPFLARHYYSFFVPKYLATADQVVTVSNFCKKDIIQHYGISDAKVTVACNGISPHFVPVNEEEQKNIRAKYAGGQSYFFYIGAIHPRKNITGLIKAFDCFKQLTGAPTKLLIAGRFAWQTSDISATYEKSIHKNDITFLGYVADEELPALSGSALALTYVSLFEGFGVPLIEAMKAEVPVITSNVSSMLEVGGEAAILVDPNSTDSMATAMQEIYENPDLRKSMIEKGRYHHQQFNWEKATDVVERAIDALSSDL